MLVFAAAALYANVGVGIESLLQDASLKGARISIYAKRFQGAEVYAKDEDQLLIPASTMKLVSTAAAFEKLGGQFTPLTIAWRTGRTVRLLGGGDPTLSAAKLKMLGEGIGVQPGDRFEFDDSRFGNKAYAPSWTSHEMMYCPPIGGLVADRATVEVWAQPGKVFLKPEKFGITVIGAPKLGEGKVIVQWIERGRTLKASGRTSGNAKRVATLSLPDPGYAAASVLGAHPVRVSLKRPDFAILPPQSNGAMSFYQVGSTKVGVLRAADIATLAHNALSNSDNFLAESILKLCGAEAGNSGAWADSLSVVGGYLASIGIPSSGYVLSDGSGLSRENRLSSKTIVTVLEHGLLSDFGETFLRCLAVPGQGTLKNRLNGVSVWAKTGTLDGVVALAGVAQPSNLRRFVFSIIINGGKGPSSAQKAVIDKIVTALGR